MPGHPTVLPEDHTQRGSTAIPALGVDRLRWGVGGLTIIDDVTFDVADGEFLSIIGPNGAGKSSLINLISGSYTPSGGTITMNGVDVTDQRSAKRIQAGLGRTFQTSSLFPQLTVHENVRIAAQARLGSSLHLWRSPRPDDDAHSITEESLEQVGLTAQAQQRVGQLSHGDKRKLELAMVLAGRPTILLLDEPTAGVSAEETAPLVDLIKGVHQSGKTVVMVEHRMEFVVGVSDRIAVLQQGRLLTIGEPSAVMADERVREAYLGGG